MSRCLPILTLLRTWPGLAWASGLSISEERTVPPLGDGQRLCEGENDEALRDRIRCLPGVVRCVCPRHERSAHEGQGRRTRPCCCSSSGKGSRLAHPASGCRWFLGENAHHCRDELRLPGLPVGCR